jgi:hypothetical protein
MSGPGSSSLQTQSSVAHAALLNSLNKDLSETRFLKSELRGRQRRAALVGEAYIVAPSSNCQHAFPSFLNFLRQTKNPQQQSNKTLRNVTKSSQRAESPVVFHDLQSAFRTRVGHMLSTASRQGIGSFEREPSSASTARKSRCSTKRGCVRT